MSPQPTSQEKITLLQLAQQARQNAYAPYSHFRVGAAVLTEKGNCFVGCNVENASYGLTLCAERNAIAAAVAGEGEAMKIRAIVVVGDRRVPCSPCGACRQVIIEFGAEAWIIYQSSDGLQETLACQLLPQSFRLEVAQKEPDLTRYPDK